MEVSGGAKRVRGTFIWSGKHLSFNNFDDLFRILHKKYKLPESNAKALVYQTYEKSLINKGSDNEKVARQEDEDRMVNTYNPTNNRKTTTTAIVYGNNRKVGVIDIKDVPRPYLHREFNIPTTKVRTKNIIKAITSKEKDDIIPVDSQGTLFMTRDLDKDAYVELIIYVRVTFDGDSDTFVKDEVVDSNMSVEETSRYINRNLGMRRIFDTDDEKEDDPDPNMDLYVRRGTRTMERKINEIVANYYNLDHGLFHHVHTTLPEAIAKPPRKVGYTRSRKGTRREKRRGPGQTEVRNLPTRLINADNNEYRVSEIPVVVIDMIKDYFSTWDYKPVLESIQVKLFDTTTRQREIDIGNTYLSKPEKHIYEEWAMASGCDTISDGYCVKRFLSYKFPEIIPKMPLKYKIDGPVHFVDFTNILHYFKISYLLFGIDGKEVMRSPTINRDRLVTGLVHNNHVEPISGYRLRRRKIKLNGCVLEKNCLNEMIRLYKTKKIHPAKVTMDIDCSKLLIKSYVIGNKRHVHDESREHPAIDDILKSFNIDNSDGHVKTISQMMYEIESGRTTVCPNSFLPNFKQFSVSPYNYTNSNDMNYDNIRKIDKNLSYGHALYSLPYLIFTDWRTYKVCDYNEGDDIVEKYLYFVKISKSSILLPHSGLYEGYHLKYTLSEYNNEMKSTVQIVQYLETDVCINHYKTIISRILQLIDSGMLDTHFTDSEVDIHLQKKEFVKSLLVRMIGKFEYQNHNKTKYEYKGIYTKEFAKSITGKYYDIPDEDLCIGYNILPIVPNVYSRLPISNQVKNMSRRVLYEKMKEMDLSTNDIIQIKTDSIKYVTCFKQISDLIDTTKPYKLEDYMRCWKTETVSEIEDDWGTNTKLCDKLWNDKPLLPVNISECTQKLIKRYAGAGKTYYVKNIVSSLNGKSYKIFTPTHQSLKGYKDLGFNCDVIQTIKYSRILPEEDLIIIDEFGMCDSSAHDLVMALKIKNKEYICLGDFNQLRPTDEYIKRYDMDHYIAFLFNTVDSTYTNFRNTFTKQYYDSLIKSTEVSNPLTNEPTYCVREVHKYSTRYPEDAEFILCYRIRTARCYNTYMLSVLKLERYDIGTKYICLTRKYSRCDSITREYMDGYTDDNESCGIESKTIFTIVDIVDNIAECITLDNKVKYMIPMKKIKTANFQLAYAVNIHNMQGSSISSYYWASEDDAFITNTIAYVVISRLQNKVYWDGVSKLEITPNTMIEMNPDNTDVNVFTYKPFITNVWDNFILDTNIFGAYDTEIDEKSESDFEETVE